MFLIQNDSDGFNRWEAIQRLAVAIIQEVVVQIQAGEEVNIDERIITAIDSLLSESLSRDKDDQFDKAMIASMLQLPTEAYLAELTDVADVDAIHEARKRVQSAISHAVEGLLLSVYKLNQSNDAYQMESAEVGRRALKNACLAYLMVDEKGESVKLAMDQFESSDNMTDTAAAVRGLINCPAEAAAEPKQKALAKFYERWSDEALVVDQWFAMQASSPLPGALDRVKALMEHDAFTLNVPNRARSVIVSFAFQNTTGFHQKDGSGYEFLADCVIQLNGLNPQLAARILSPLTRWRKYDEARQSLMKAQLERILAEQNLSPDVFEIASKSV